MLAALITYSFSGCASIQSQPNRDRGLAGILGIKKNDGRGSGQDLLDNVDPLGRRSFNRLLLEDLSPGNLATTVAVRTTFEEDRPAAEAAYREGQQFYQQALSARDANPDGTDHKDFFPKGSQQIPFGSRQIPGFAIGTRRFVLRRTIILFCKALCASQPGV